MPNMQLDTINSLYLELSQVATATTAKEIKLHRGIGDARSAALNLCYEIENLPASEQQTKVSVLATALQKRLNDLLP
jgi:hypothetical protein